MLQIVRRRNDFAFDHQETRRNNPTTFKAEWIKDMQEQPVMLHRTK